MNKEAKLTNFKKAYRKKWKHVIYIMPIQMQFPVVTPSGLQRGVDTEFAI